MRKRIASFGMVLIAFALVGCAAVGAQSDPATATPVVERETSPETVDVATLVADNTAFAFDLYRQLAQEQNGNLIFSPYSISLALTMVYAGARGETAEQMAATMHYTLPQDRLHTAFNALDSVLQPPNLQATPIPTNDVFGGSPADDLTLRIANAVWGQIGFPLEQTYLQTLGQNYGVNLEQVDFAANPEAAWQMISQWVAQATGGRIENMPPRDVITTATRLVLANAIYFQAEWTYPFQAELTQDTAFHLLDGSDVTVPMMSNSFAYFDCARGENYYAVRLTYGERGNAAMLMLLPDEGAFEDFESSLDASLFQDVLASLQSTNLLTVDMPRFDFEADINLNDTLSTMGMPLPFSGAADFTGITPDGLFIDYAAHRATISVDEQGTEATGVTMAIMLQSAMMTECESSVVADRPFIFAIYDRATNAVLFMGRVLNPAR